MNLKKVLIFLLISSNLMAISIRSIEFKKSGENYLYEVDVPNIKSDNIKYQNSFNKEIENLKNKTIQDVLKITKENEEFNIQSQLVMKYEDYKSEIGITSIILETYEYTGGAHGMTNLKVFNLNSKSGEDIKIEKIMKLEGLKYLQEQIQKEIQENLIGPLEERIYFPDAKVDIRNANIYFDGEFVVIIFNLYDIAPYSSGIPTFKYSLESVKQYLIAIENS